MKFLLSVAAVIAVAVAGPVKDGLVTPGFAGIAPVIIPGAAGPAPIIPGAAGPAPIIPGLAGPAPVIVPQPIAIGPAIIDSFEPIDIGPAWIDFPVPDGGFVDDSVVIPAPAVAAPAANTPLVQIILNINQASESSPVVIGHPEIIAEPVQVVESAPVSPVVVEPVQVVETAPVPAEPVLIGTPVMPSPAVTLPEELN